MARYDAFLRKQTIRYGEAFDPSDLAPQFRSYFETGRRIKVRISGQEITGTVGVTTGWRPSFLLMRRTNGQHSALVLDTETEILAVKKGRKYHPLAEKTSL